ncbi:MAG: hypothetical protein JXK92_09260 [Erysipelotrichaceae bacterium]|nr:hypothetical protein [Erysipelotrichaceae bacterium]
MGKLKSICISQERGVLKSEVDECLVIEGFGIEHDGHGGEWGRQITVLNFQSYLKARQDHPDLDLHPGSFAENLMVDGIDFSLIKPLSRIRLGDSVILEVSQIGKEDHPSVVTRTYGISLLPYEGLFCRVVEGGRLKKEDEAELVSQ